MENDCVHIKGIVSKIMKDNGDVDYIVTCDHCHAAWLFGLHPAGMNLYDVRGERWY
jgi:hypothetical protein